jgi:hypothetical protein
MLTGCAAAAALLMIIGTPCKQIAPSNVEAVESGSSVEIVKKA